MENIEIIDTLDNPRGLFSINSEEKIDVIAYLNIIDENDKNKTKINIKIKNYENSSEININTKEDMISYICLNYVGNLLAIANEKGSEIKIYDCIIII